MLSGGKFSDLLDGPWHTTTGSFTNSGRKNALELIHVYFCNRPETDVAEYVLTIGPGCLTTY